MSAAAPLSGNVNATLVFTRSGGSLIIILGGLLIGLFSWLAEVLLPMRRHRARD